ncbi:MAG: carboxypeptidase-like regulatory domain-containing protein [Acidobacteriaceae bacterium]
MLLLPTGASAQIGGSGTIEGTITDTTGAVIPGATITARNIATGSEMVRTSNGDGRYNVSPLQVGTYNVKISAKGFETLLREKISLNGMQVLPLDATLQLGKTDVTVTVTAAPPPLETENATLGATMDHETYTSMPIEMGGANGVSTDQRRVTDYAVLMPGATNNEIKNNESDEPMVVNGYSSGTTMYVEGLPLESASTAGDPRFIWPAFSVETIDQFQLKTTGYSPAYQGIGVENFTMKSGTNKIHGSFYDIFRNTALDAAGFIPAQYPANYPNAALAGKYYTPPEHMNEYGMTIGGPIWKNKVFLFGNYSGFRYSTLTKPQAQTIPTPAELCGDFSALGQNIYDPTTQVETGTGTSASYTRTPFSGNSYTSAGCGTGPVIANVIPANELSPIAQYLQKFMPAPTNSNLTNNYFGSYEWGLNNWSTADRLDFDINEKHKASVIFAMGRQGLMGPSGSQTTNVAPLPYRYAKNYAPISKDVIVEDTYVINNNLVNQFKWGAAQYHSPDNNPDYGISEFSAATAGITNLPTGQASGSFPYEKFSGGTQDPASWGPQSGYVGNTDAFTLLDNVQWVKGRHSFSFGGQYEWMEYNYLTDDTGSSIATMSFAQTETAQVKGSSAAVQPNSGQPYASYLLGAVDTGSYTQYAPIAQITGARYHPFGIYANDDWQVTPKLTVNLGLRWDVMPPFREAEDRFSFLNPTATNPVTGSPGILEFAGHGTDSCNCTTPLQTYYKDLGPRLGFAWQTTHRIVARGSYGIYYGKGGGTSGGQTSLPSTAMELGYAVAPSFVTPGDSLPAFYLNNSSYFTGFAGGSIANTSFGNSAGANSVAAPPVFDPQYATYYSTNAKSPDKISSSLAYLDPYYGGRTPTFEGWSIGTQILVTKDMTATISYVGNQGHFLVPTGSPRGYWSNQLDPKYLSLGATALGATATASNMPAGTTLPYSTFNYKVYQALVAFPQYSGVTDQLPAVGNSNYNALQIFVQQRISHGLSFMLSYTFSKTIDDVGTFRTGYAIPAGVVANSSKAYPIDRIERSLSTQDQPQNVVGTASYDLPFGKNHIGGGNPIVSAIVSDWRLSGIFTYVSGNPLALTSASCSGITGQGTCMPEYTPGFTGAVRQNGKWGQGATRTTLASTQYINPGAFEEDLSDTLGNTARTAPDGLRGPSNYNLDASIRRTFNIWKNGRVKLVFDASAFNTFNHVWFGSPASTADGAIGSSVGSSSFGTVAGQANNPRQFQFGGHINY